MQFQNKKTIAYIIPYYQGYPVMDLIVVPNISVRRINQESTDIPIHIEPPPPPQYVHIIQHDYLLSLSHTPNQKRCAKPPTLFIQYVSITAPGTVINSQAANITIFCVLSFYFYYWPRTVFCIISTGRIRNNIFCIFFPFLVIGKGLFK